MKKCTTQIVPLTEDERILLSSHTEDSVFYGLKNDYMFHAVLQTCGEALRGLLSALLDISEEEILSCKIQNPIILGDAISEKTCILDIRVILNGNRQINLEMQIGSLNNWTDRSLFYLCKMFTDLKHGEDYSLTKSSVHIGIVSTSPLPEDTAFYNEYALLNRKSGYEFTDKFSLRVLDLSYLDRVPPEEQNTPLYYWASAFKARSWKELMKLAELSEPIKKAVLTLNKLSDDEKIRLQCEARERYWMDQQVAMREAERTKQAIAFAKNQLAVTEKQLESTENRLASTENRLASTKKQLDSTKNQLDSTKNQLDSTENQLTSTKKQLDSTKNQLTSTKKQLDSTENRLKLKIEQVDSEKARADSAEKLADSIALELEKYKKLYGELSD